MNIKLSETAINRMKHFLKTRGKGIGIRLGVQTSGCSGMAYVVEYTDNIEIDDEVVEIDDLKIIVNKKSSIYLDGIVIDFQKEGLNEGFKFDNPNAKGQCGCGESFTV